MWRLKNSFFSISSFLAFKKLKKTFFADFRVTVQISKAKRQVKNQQQEVKFWYWDPKTIWLTLSGVLFFQNHSTLTYSYSTDLAPYAPLDQKGQRVTERDLRSLRCDLSLRN